MNPVDPELRIFLLGQFRVGLGTQWVDGAVRRRRKVAKLIQALALARGQCLHREQVMEALWPEEGPAAAANNLHQTLYLARRALVSAGGTDHRYLRLDMEQVCLCPAATVWTDVAAFQQAARTAHSAQDPAAYRLALEYYTGDLLPEELYEDWTFLLREELRATYLDLLLQLAALHEQEGQLDQALATLQQVLDRDPAHEAAAQSTMRLLAHLGRRQDAIRLYQQLAAVLRRELEVEPAPETQRLLDQLRAAAATPSPRPAAPPPGNLPHPVSSFIGRTREKAEVQRLLNRTRLLTLTGPGGCGKTRLALEVAHEVRAAYPHGAWFVDLAGLSDPAVVPRAVAAAVHAPEHAGQDVVETLAAFLQDRHLLLVLDNCEHLLASCAALASRLLQHSPRLQILATSRELFHLPGEIIWLVPSLALLEPEQLPPLADIARNEAIQLFCERASAVSPGFSLSPDNARSIAEICLQLDGIPLAIELAAARANLLSADQILARLHDRFHLLSARGQALVSRHQALRNTIDWSYDLLEEPERQLFRRLAVFAGSFDLDAAERVCAGPDLAETAVGDLLESLIDKSLVSVVPSATAPGGTVSARYRLLHTTREYARERLEDAGEIDCMRDQHRQWCLRMAEQANLRLWSQDHIAALVALEREYDNLRAALAYRSACSSTDKAGGLQLAQTLWQFWILRGDLAEGRYWLDKLMADVHPAGRLRGQALLQQYALGMRAGDNLTIPPLLEESLEIFRATEDDAGQCRAWQLYAAQAWLQGDCITARAGLVEAYVHAQEGGDAAGIAAMTHFLGVVAASEGDLAQAEAHMAASLQLFRALGSHHAASSLFLNALWPVSTGRFTVIDPETLILLREVGARSATGYGLANLGTVSWLAGDHPGARRWLEQSLAAFRETGDLAGTSQVLAELGILASSTGDRARGQQCLEDSLAMRRTIGDSRGRGRTLSLLGHLAAASTEHARAQALFDEAFELFRSTGDRPGVAACLSHRATLAALQGDFSRANTLLAESLSIFTQLPARRAIAGCLLNMGVAAAMSGDLATAHRHLGDALGLLEQIRDQHGARIVARELAGLGHPTSDPAPATRERQQLPK